MSAIPSFPGPSTGASEFMRVVRQSVDGWLDSAIAHALEWLESPSKRQRISVDYEHTAGMLLLLRQRRSDLVRHVAAALREHLDAHTASQGFSDRPPPPSADERALRLLRGLAGDASASAAAPAPSAPPSPALRLTLISEAQIDSEIETARIVQQVEAAAEAELQELAALCSGLVGRPSVDPAMVPLRPADCARALAEGIDRLAPEQALRPALLRLLGQAVAEQLRPVYTSQIEWLQLRGVSAASFRIVPTPVGGATPLQPDPATGAFASPRLPEPAESMRTLVERNRRVRPPLEPGPESDVPGPAAGDADGAPSLRLLDAPRGFDADDGPLPRAVAEEMMRGLFAELHREAGTTPGMAEFLKRLDRLSQRVAAADPALWSDPAHPWWNLLDRLLASGAVQDDLSPPDRRVLRRSLDEAMQRVEEAPRLDDPACFAAADEAQLLASRLLENAAEPPAEEVDALQRLAEREELEATFRGQIVQQLRSTPTSTAMRRFLVGPWTLVLVAAAERGGSDSPAVAAAALVVDDLIRATAQPGRGVSQAQRNVLLRQVSDGLTAAGMPPARREAELSELTELLRDPPEHPFDAQEAWAEEHVEPLPVPFTLDLHAGLPTVPLALPEGAAPEHAAPRATPEDWLDSLQAGACCRLFLQGRWMTVRLHWVGPGHRLFLFHSRQGGRSHSLTRRMLHKLREAGLATSIEDSLLRAQAMDSLVRARVV